MQFIKTWIVIIVIIGLVWGLMNIMSEEYYAARDYFKSHCSIETPYTQLTPVCAKAYSIGNISGTINFKQL